MAIEFRKRSVQSYETLVQPHLDRLYRLAYRYTNSPDDAEDLVQDLLLKFLPQYKKLLEVSDLGPWLARSMHNLFIDQVRKRSIRPVDMARHEKSEELIEQTVDEASLSPEKSAEQMVSQNKLLSALQKLSPEHRAVISWHDVEGYTLQELSDEHDLPLGTLKSRLHRARAILREKLMEPF